MQSSSQTYDILAVGAHPDDIEVAMGGTVARLRQQGKSILIVDLCRGEPARHAAPGVRQKQAQEAARILGVDRITLDLQDRLIADTVETRLTMARLIRIHQPRWIFTTRDCAIHPDHRMVGAIVEHGAYYARLPKWEEVAGGEVLAGTRPHDIERIFYYHCRMEPPWERFDFAVDVSDVYDLKQKAIAVYESVFGGEQQEKLVPRFEAEDRYVGRLLEVEYAEMFRARSPILLTDLEAIAPVRYG